MIRDARIRLVAMMVVATVSGTTAVTAQVPTRPARATWLTDRQALEVGDVLTIIVDERMTARERAGRTATSERSQNASLGLESPDFTLPLTAGSFASGLDARSRNLGEANREGDLSAVMTVLVVGVEPTGLLRLEGERTIAIDGRTQEMRLEGLVRPEDVSASNLVFSNRIANAQLTLDGNEISPKKGILGSILSILWP